MKRARLSLLGMVALFSVATYHAEARGDLIACTPDSGIFYRVSTANAALSVLANTGITGLGDLQRSPDGTLYGFTYSLVATPTLYRFDSTTYAATAIGPLGLPFVFEGALAFTSGGIAYGANAGNSGTPTLFTINLATGAATLGPVISGAPHDINGMAFRSDGNLVALDDNTNSLLVINPTTGAATTLASIGAAVGPVGGLTIDGDTGYFATAGPGNSIPGSNQLYSFNVSTGAQTLIGSFAPTISSGRGISGLTFFPSTTSVPEPSSLILAAVGLIGVAGMAQRARQPRTA